MADRESSPRCFQRDLVGGAMAKCIGILTAGGDTPGLNAAIRGIGKAALGAHGMRVIGFRDGFRGMMENRTVMLDSSNLSGILTIGGTKTTTGATSTRWSAWAAAALRRMRST